LYSKVNITLIIGIVVVDNGVGFKFDQVLMHSLVYVIWNKNQKKFKKVKVQKKGKE